MFNNSAINNTAIHATVDAIVGEGLVCSQTNLLDEANSEGESWNDIFKKISLDYKLYGGFTLEVIWSKDRSRIAEVYHIDFSWLRAKEKNERGKIPGYYISDEWAEKYRAEVERKADTTLLARIAELENSLAAVNARLANAQALVPNV